MDFSACRAFLLSCWHQQRVYTIEGSETWNYRQNDLGGGFRTVSGTSTGCYTVTQQPDYNQLAYSLGLAICQWRDRKPNEKILQQAQQVIASWEQRNFKSHSPIIPAENRGGNIMFWTGSKPEPQPPFRVVLFLTDPVRQNEEHVTFAFGEQVWTAEYRSLEQARDSIARWIEE
jgi:hypothetical protein